MERIRALPARIRAAVAAKLGVCPVCMRSAARGAVGGWAAATIVAFVWPLPVLLAASLAVAGAFTLLLLAHVVAFAVRATPVLAERERRRADGATLDRRRFLGLGARAGLVALALSLGLPARAWAQDKDTCTGTHDVLPPFRFWAQTVDPPGQDAALDRWKQEAGAFCEEFCKKRKCADPEAKHCVSTGFVASDMFFLRPPGDVPKNQANGQVEQCKCKCSKQTTEQAFHDSIKELPDEERKKKKKAFDDLQKRGDDLFKEWEKQKKQDR